MTFHATERRARMRPIDLRAAASRVTAGVISGRTAAGARPARCHTSAEPLPRGAGGGRLQVGRGPAGVEVALDALGVLDAEHDGVDRATGQREALKSQRSLNLSDL